MDCEFGAYAVKDKTLTNWSKTFSCSPESYFEPECEEEIKKILEFANQKKKVVRCIGCGQSPSDIQFSNDYLISMRKFNKLLSVDSTKRLVQVQAGITVKELNEILPKHGLALSVVGAISDISIGGAISTGTHNSGITFGTMASYVVDLDLITADGTDIKCSREENKDLFLATCCGLGAMGVIVNVTIQCEPGFNLKQTRYPLRLRDTIDCLTTHLKSSDHFRFMWFPHTDDVLMDHMSRTEDKIPFQSPFSMLWSWFQNYVVGFYLLELAFWISCFVPYLTPKINSWAFWWLHRSHKHRVDRGDRILNIECLFQQYVNEWAIPVEKTGIVLFELKEWLAKNSDVYFHFPVEVRFVKQEDYFLSPAHGRDSCYINILSYRPYGRTIPHDRLWAAYEEIMRKAGGRPHWAKEYHVTAKEFGEMYPFFDNWCNLRQKYDPNDIFKNSYMNRLLS